MIESNISVKYFFMSVITSSYPTCDGSAVADNNVQTTYFEKRIANAENTARKEDNPADVATPAASTSEKEDAMMAAFDKAVLGGR